MRLVLRHAWLNLWDKHMTTGRINQITEERRVNSQWRNKSQREKHELKFSSYTVKYPTHSTIFAFRLLDSFSDENVKRMKIEAHLDAIQLVSIRRTLSEQPLSWQVQKLAVRGNDSWNSTVSHGVAQGLKSSCRLFTS